MWEIKKQSNFQKKILKIFITAAYSYNMVTINIVIKITLMVLEILYLVDI